MGFLTCVLPIRLVHRVTPLIPSNDINVAFAFSSSRSFEKERSRPFHPIARCSSFRRHSGSFILYSIFLKLPKTIFLAFSMEKSARFPRFHFLSISRRSALSLGIWILRFPRFWQRKWRFRCCWRWHFSEAACWRTSYEYRWEERKGFDVEPKWLERIHGIGSI